MVSFKKYPFVSLLLKTLLIAAVVETIIIVLLPRMISKEEWPFPYAFLDASLSALLMAPFLWWLVIRPIRTNADKVVSVAESALWEKNEALRALIQASPLAILSFGMDSNIRSWNQAAERIFGWSEQEVVGRPLPFVPKGKEEEFRMQFEKVLRGESFTGMERWRQRKDGSSIAVSISAAPLYDAAGNVIGNMSVVADITEHKKTEEKINRLNRVYAMLSAIDKAIVQIRNRDELFEEACRIAVAYGQFRMAWIGVIEPETFAVKPVAHFGFEEGYLDDIKIVAADTARGRGPAGTAIRNKKHFVCNDIEHDPSMLPWRTEALKRGYRANASFPILFGSQVTAIITFYADAPDFFDNEEIRLLDELAHDLSFALEFMEKEKLRRAAEKIALEAKQDWEDTFDTITDMITVHDKDFNIIRANKAAEKILNIPALTMTRAKCFFYYHGAECPPSDCPSCQSLVTGKPSLVEFFEPHLNTFLEICAIPRHDIHDNIIGLIHIVRDITARKQLEEKNAGNESRLRAIIETAPECVKLLDAEGTILEMNAAGLAMMEADSPEQVRGKSIYPLIVPEDRPAVQAMVEKVFQGSLETLEFEITGMKGTRRWVQSRSVPLRDANGNITAYLGVARDITKQKILETQLRHAQKMEAVGTLTSGIAHDFNNILTAIIGYANVIKLKTGQNDPVRLYAEQILASTERATGLTQGLLAFSRKVTINLRPVNLNEIVERVQKLLRRLISEDITLKTECIKRKTTAIADSSQIEQVLMNLVTNARDAMPEGGVLTISTDIAQLDSGFINTHGYGKTGPYAVLSVSDTGIGMDDMTRDRVFEPFFTTKDVGKGTGLGLSIVYGIIKQHDGFILCESKPGQGTTFIIYLPLVKASIQEREPKTAALPKKGGTETILIAEDDAEVRELTKTILKEFGYAVIEAEDGEAAVRKFRENRDRVKLLLFDLVMPKKDGKEAYEEIKKTKPGIKTIFMSGYSTNIAARKGIPEKDLAFLLKPLTPATLLKKIREVLDK